MMDARPQRERCAHRVATPDRLLDAEMIQQRNQVGAFRAPAVGLDNRKASRTAVTSGVGQQHSEHIVEWFEISHHHRGVFNRATVNPERRDAVWIAAFAPEDLHTFRRGERGMAFVGFVVDSRRHRHEADTTVFPASDSSASAQERGAVGHDARTHYGSEDREQLSRRLPWSADNEDDGHTIDAPEARSPA